MSLLTRQAISQTAFHVIIVTSVGILKAFLRETYNDDNCRTFMNSLHHFYSSICGMFSLKIENISLPHEYSRHDFYHDAPASIYTVLLSRLVLHRLLLETNGGCWQDIFRKNTTSVFFKTLVIIIPPFFYDVLWGKCMLNDRFLTRTAHKHNACLEVLKCFDWLFLGVEGGGDFDHYWFLLENETVRKANKNQKCEHPLEFLRK